MCLKRKEDSFSPVKPTRIFSPSKFVLTLKMIRAINFTVCYSCRSISINPKFPKPLNKSFIYTYILLKKKLFFDDKSH